MNLYLMKCGHVNQGVTSEGKPACAICGCFDVEKPIVKPTDGLEGRQCKCADCGHVAPSAWNQAFFKYQPDREFDSYYCGCYGWN